MAPDRWTLGTWKAKCHILIMHEVSGGKDVAWGNTWKDDCHVSKGLGKVSYT